VALSGRVPYQAQVDRPKLTLPGGKKLALWVLNVEEWRIENAMPRTVLSPPMGQPLLPDVPNWSWHEYGMRAGSWRQFKALTDRKMPVTLADGQRDWRLVSRRDGKELKLWLYRRTASFRRSVHEDALPSPAINRPKLPRANSRGSCLL
jgi:hypothetical protein